MNCHFLHSGRAPEAADSLECYKSYHLSLGHGPTPGKSAQSAPAPALGAGAVAEPGGHTPIAPPPPLSVTQWAREALHFEPFPAQAEILDCRDSHVILCCSRQFGKTTLTALKAAHHALTLPGANIVVGSPSERQSCLLVRKAANFLKRAGTPTRATGDNTKGVRLPNGSCIFALPMQQFTTRGFDAVSLLIFEEAAYIPDPFYHMATAFQAVVPNRCLWLLSTPGGESGFFYEEWSDAARAHWRRFRVPASQCPPIDGEFLAQERIRKGDAVFRREYECEFVSDAAQIIGSELWLANLDETDLPFNGGKPLWRD
ncbi:terminase large subunit domain-containing protein [uncultured Paludibaculum sp.]|uniref:terminase large subunit domain-containing protein n=1 Tax=uncultured Paludibaculum sp. TaxID=1765020 RepID=UPI002AABE60B|nr:terminase family protein [uncultured Paludibaculum sp.]